MPQALIQRYGNSGNTRVRYSVIPNEAVSPLSKLAANERADAPATAANTAPTSLRDNIDSQHQQQHLHPPLPRPACSLPVSSSCCRVIDLPSFCLSSYLLPLSLHSIVFPQADPFSYLRTYFHAYFNSRVPPIRTWACCPTRHSALIIHSSPFAPIFASLRSAVYLYSLTIPLPPLRHRSHAVSILDALLQLAPWFQLPSCRQGSLLFFSHSEALRLKLSPHSSACATLGSR